MESSTKDDRCVMSIIAAALRRPPTERELYLRLACAEDRELYRETMEAVRWEERMGNFLQHPLITFKDFGPPFRAGQNIAERFEILREIGEGGMGIVYEAFDQRRKTRIAIKAAKPGFQRLLSPELEGALKVRHPNVCLVNEIHTAQTDHGEIDFLTMEFLDGVTLSKHLNVQGKLTQKEALEVASQLCAGVAEAHRSGIIHRDLKSANVILCRSAEGLLRAVITDFGLAGAMTLQFGEVVGTPGYIAPELWRGEKASKASDIYSLGVVLYEMVTGRLPFEQKLSESCLASIPPAPSVLAKSLKRRWDRVILQCLDPSPAARPTDAGQVFAGLEAKPARKWPPLAAMIVVVVSLSLPQVRDWVRELIWPRPNVRLAILPFEGTTDRSLIQTGMMQDVSERIGHLRGGRRTVTVIPASEAATNGVHTPEQAKTILHATHALRATMGQLGGVFTSEGAIIDLSTQVPLRTFSARYSSQTVGTLPAALAGEISLALHLRGSAAEELAPQATISYDRGLYLVRNDRQSFGGAISLFQQAAHLDPRSSLPLAGLVEAKVLEFEITRQRSCLDEAHQSLRAAESLNPDSVRVRLAAGLLSETAGQYEKALEDYRRVHDLEPRNVDAFLRIGRLYDRLDISDKAIETYREAIDLDPAYYESYEELGLFFYYRGKYPEAAENFRKAIARAPGIADGYTSLGGVMTDQGLYKEAEQVLLESLKLRKTAPALNNLGAIRAYQRRDLEAVAYYTGAVAINSHEYVYLLNLGDSYRRLHRLADAKTIYREGMNQALAELKENPRLGYPRAFVAYFAARLGDRERAEDEITQALQLAPGDNKVIRRAVLTYEALAERDRAFAALNGATPPLLRELDRQPDLAGFREDLRFQELVNQTKKGGK